MEHVPVMCEEVLTYLDVKPDGTYVDCTVGDGGHALAIGQLLGSSGRILGIDLDPRALETASRRLAGLRCRVDLVEGNFAQLGCIMQKLGIAAASGFLFDLGASARQLYDPARGFSYQHDGPLDMRMGPGVRRTAADLVNEASEDELARILREYGEERHARRIARFIVAARQRRPITSTAQLVEVIKSAIPARWRRRGPHPARRTFQALRIAVNRELDNLTRGLKKALERSEEGGRIVVIAFHSLEDRVVKSLFREAAGENRVEILTSRVIRPTNGEVERNPRARSARLRAVRVLRRTGGEY